MKPRASFYLLAIAVVVLAATTPLADEPSYSSAPYADPIRDVAEYMVEWAAFNNWLNTNHDTVPAGKRQALKEHLYLIIDSHIKHLHAQEGQIFPEDWDLILSQCFTWATRMGVFGAHSVLEALAPEIAAKVPTTASIPSSFDLMMRQDMLVLSSSRGDWSVTFPYHFMIVDLQQFRARNGLQTQMAIVSTGFGRHTADEGFSQATVSLVYSPEGQPDSFQEFWLEMFGLSGVGLADEQVNGMNAVKKLDPSSKMYTELLFPKVDQGALAIAYMGLAGTYEHNRPHFIDLVAHLQQEAPG